MGHSCPACNSEAVSDSCGPGCELVEAADGGGQLVVDVLDVDAVDDTG